MRSTRIEGLIHFRTYCIESFELLFVRCRCSDSIKYSTLLVSTLFTMQHFNKLETRRIILDLPSILLLQIPQPLNDIPSIITIETSQVIA